MAGRGRIERILFAVAVIVSAFCVNASAQFKSEAFTQQYNDDPSQQDRDSVATMFSLKEYMGGLAHKNELKIGTMTAGSFVFVGGSQIYNRQYWKLPLLYGGIGAGVGLGLNYRNQGRNDVATWCFVGAGVAYWAGLMDGVVSYKPAEYPHPGRATLYSLLLPGLGQIYNHEYWKLPIYLGGMAAATNYYLDFRTNYERFRRIYNEACDETVPYQGPITKEQALYYRNVYRRYRDYSLLAIAAVYLLQVIDANVFTYMHNFEVDDDLSLRVEPTVLAPGMQLASSGFGGGAFGGVPSGSAGIGGAALGLRLGLSF